MTVWWEEASEDERRMVSGLASVQRTASGVDLMASPYLSVIRDALLEALFASGSDLLLMPLQDVFGWRDRINVPATVNEENWTFRLPWAIDHIDDAADARERQHALREWTRKHSR